MSGRRDQRKDAGALPLILCCGDESVPEILRIQERIAGDKSPSELFFCDSIEGTVEMARAGFGAAIIPEIFVKDDDKLENIRSAATEPLPWAFITVQKKETSRCGRWQRYSRNSAGETLSVIP